MDRSRVAIVIPALNESATIEALVRSVKKYGMPIVVDDGSKDGTGVLAREAGAYVISHKVNKGYDAALNSGFIKASEIASELIITIDADGQHNPELIEKFINQIDAGAELVVGVRDVRCRFAENIFAWYTILRYKINDPLCGMKAYRTKVYQDQGYFDSYGSVGTELLLYAARKKYRIDQVRFQVRHRDGQSRFGNILSSNLRIFRAIFIHFIYTNRI